MSGGWGYSSNPFSQPGATAADDVDVRVGGPTGGAAGSAWGNAPPPPPAAGALPPGVQQAAVAAAAPPAKKTGFFGRGGGGKASAAPPPPAFTSAGPVSAFATAAPAGGGGDLATREAAVARREAEVARREAELAAGGAAPGGRRPNFPPFCSFIYHDISADVPPWHRSSVRVAFMTELLELLGFFYNLLITLIAMFANAGIDAKWWFVGLIAFLLGVPASWYLWYKSLFNSASTDGATYSYVRTMLLIILNITWCVWMILAIDGLGSFSAGIFPMLNLFSAGGSKNIAFGVCYIVNVVLWGLAGLGSWLSLGLAIRMYRQGDGPRKEYESSYGPWNRV